MRAAIHASVLLAGTADARSPSLTSGPSRPTLISRYACESETPMRRAAAGIFSSAATRAGFGIAWFSMICPFCLACPGMDVCRRTDHGARFMQIKFAGGLENLFLRWRGFFRPAALASHGFGRNLPRPFFECPAFVSSFLPPRDQVGVISDSFSPGYRKRVTDTPNPLALLLIVCLVALVLPQLAGGACWFCIQPTPKRRTFGNRQPDTAEIPAGVISVHIAIKLLALLPPKVIF